METQNLIENSKKKLEKKHLDLIAANSIKEEGAGFGTSTNRITLISKNDMEALPLLSKDETAHRLLDQIMKLRA